MLLGITGSLIYTGSIFAQVLEGPLTALEKLVRVIQADLRHDVLVVTEPKTVAVRRFKNWSLAYWGPSTYVFVNLARCLDDDAAVRERNLSALVRLMSEFAIRQDQGA